MKTVFGILGGSLLAILILYALWAVFIPMMIGRKWVDRKVTENSQQYVESQRSALLNLYNGYTSTSNEAHKTAIKAQMCEIANTVGRNEVPKAVMPVVGGCL